jgi:cob(I)alamin adenosyltransferase
MARRLTVLVAVTVLGLGVVGCAGFRAERQGRDVGRAICDIKQADNPDEAQRALDKLNRRVEKAVRITGRPVNEDVRDIQENVRDLTEHVSQRQSELAKQDVAVIRRNVQTVVEQAPELTKRFYEGVSEGLGDCT